jgi:hypothetical protein
MKNEKTWVLVLSGLAMALLLIASLTGILSDDGGKVYRATSQRGASVEIYGGEGVYQYDSVNKAVGFQGFDWANLAVGLPLFFLGVTLYRRSQIRGQILLAAMFAYLAYNYLIGVMGNAFNSLFLVWTALFSIGLFGMALVLAGVHIPSLPEKLGAHFPRRSLSIYALSLGLFLLFSYLGEILPTFRSGSTTPPSLEIYTTLELAAVELGLMVPLHILGAILLWRRYALGYLLAIILAVTAMLTFISLTASRLILYFRFERGSVSDLAITIILALAATGFSAVIYRQVKG